MSKTYFCSGCQQHVSNRMVHHCPGTPSPAGAREALERAVEAERSYWLCQSVGSVCRDINASFDRIIAALCAPLERSGVQTAPVTWRVEHDGFEGVEIGSYTTLEGKHGVVLQQIGTRVVHVYGRKWLASALSSAEGK